MTELYLIRHAQASFGAENYDKLSDLGHTQSRWLGEYLAEQNFDFDVVMLGDLVRHRETLDGMHKGLSAHPQITDLNNKLSQATVLPHLNEFDFKSVATSFIQLNPELAPSENTTKAEFFTVFKKAVFAWSQGELDEHVPERWSDFQGRVEDFQSLLCNDYVGKKVLAVTSGGAIGMAVSQMLGASNESMIELNLQIRNTSVTHCFFNDKKVRLHTFNHVPHLDRHDRKKDITYS